jgi:hypothetical protein
MKDWKDETRAPRSYFGIQRAKFFYTTQLSSKLLNSLIVFESKF